MASAALINFLTYGNSDGTLSVYECGKQVPFDIRRVFTVSARKNDVRGNHAHKKCTQLLVCISGKILVSCDDGSVSTQYLLDNMSIGLLVPPGIWASEEYVDNAAVLMVLCDRGYEADDYIRDYNDFKNFLV